MADSTRHPAARGGGGQVAPHLSIGEVLGLILEEFPDVTISKIRFLESQGLIEPERTPSGYRKFYDGDVQLLRTILREQRENFLPLRVIKDRIDKGEIAADDDAETDAGPGRGVRNVVANTSDAAGPDGRLPGFDDADEPAAANTGDGKTEDETVNKTPDVPPTEPDVADSAVADDSAQPPPDAVAEEPEPIQEPAPANVPDGFLTRAELASHAVTTPAHVDELCSFGLIASTDHYGEPMFDTDAAQVATLCARLIDLGIDARHLRGWRTSVDRELGLYEGLTMPLLRQRNPHGRELAVERLGELNELGTQLRQVLLDVALRPHLGRS